MPAEELYRLPPKKYRELVRKGFNLAVADLRSDDPVRQQDAHDRLLPAARSYGHSSVESFLQDELAVKSLLWLTM
jgi:hypothetical protein